MPQFGGYPEKTGGGEKGDPGNQGVKGDTGKQGKPGVDGTNGKNGIDGIDGTDGINGIDGSTGARGKPGEGGTNGTDGQDGHQGTAGIDGTNGHDGHDGARGEKGDIGLPGSRGATGAQGRDGIDVASVPTIDDYILIDTKSASKIDAALNTEQHNKALNNIEHNSIKNAVYNTATGKFTFAEGIYEYFLYSTFYDTNYTDTEIKNIENTSATATEQTEIGDFHGTTKASAYITGRIRTPIILQGQFQVKPNNKLSFTIQYKASLGRASGLYDSASTTKTNSYYLIKQLGTGEAVVGPKGDRGDDGQDGAAGAQGDPGENGKHGTHGIDGRDGDPGPKGNPGPKGDKGETGGENKNLTHAITNTGILEGLEVKENKGIHLSIDEAHQQSFTLIKGKLDKDKIYFDSNTKEIKIDIPIVATSFITKIKVDGFGIDGHKPNLITGWKVDLYLNSTLQVSETNGAYFSVASDAFDGFIIERDYNPAVTNKNKLTIKMTYTGITNSNVYMHLNDITVSVTGASGHYVTAGNAVAPSGQFIELSTGQVALGVDGYVILREKNNNGIIKVIPHSTRTNDDVILDTVKAGILQKTNRELAPGWDTLKITEAKLAKELIHKLHLDHKLKGYEDVFVAQYAGNKKWTVYESNDDVMHPIIPITHSDTAISDLITFQFQQNSDLAGGIYLLKFRMITTSDCSYGILNKNDSGVIVQGDYTYRYIDNTRTTFSNSIAREPRIARHVAGDCRIDILLINNGKDILTTSNSYNTKKYSKGESYNFVYTNYSYYHNQASKQGVENVIKKYLTLNLQAYRNRKVGLQAQSFIRIIREVTS